VVTVSLSGPEESVPVDEYLLRWAVI
jgi:hypothetical protein